MREVVYFGSRAIYEDMVTAVKSLLYHTKVDKVYLLIEDDTHPNEFPDCVEIINIRDVVPTIFDENGPNYDSGWTYIGLIRAALTKVFPDKDKILSIDCDTIVLEDISELWDIDIEDYYFAAVEEPLMTRIYRMKYTNAGVMMLNLKKLREIDDKIIHALDTQKFGFVAQDVLNRFCQDGIKLISNKYNACAYTGVAEEKKIVHYAGERRVWRDYPIVKTYRELPWI